MSTAIKLQRTCKKYLYFEGKVKASKSESGSVIVEGFANRFSKNDKQLVDRGGDLIPPEAWLLEEFKSLPIIFFNHDRDQPVGKATMINPTKDGLFIRVKISDSDHPEIKRVRDLVKEGILRAFSVGFDPMEEEEKEIEGKQVNMIMKANLLEVSIVSLPMAQHSLFEVTTKSLANMSYDQAVNLLTKTQTSETKPEIKEEVEPMQKQEDGLDVQELVFSKDVFESASDAETWARDHDFIAENIDETDTAFILQQRDPQEFEEGSLRSVDLADGIKATMGKLKVPQKDAFQDCVSSKIRKLRGEGVKPDEAVAQALAFCRSEQGKSCELNLNQLQSAFELAKSIKDPGQQISASGDDPTNFGDPHLDVAKQTNVLLGQLVREVQLLSEKLNGLKQPEYDNPDDTAETGDSGEPSSMNDNLKNEKLGLIEMYKKECERILRQVGC